MRDNDDVLEEQEKSTLLTTTVKDLKRQLEEANEHIKSQVTEKLQLKERIRDLESQLSISIDAHKAIEREKEDFFQQFQAHISRNDIWSSKIKDLEQKQK